MNRRDFLRAGAALGVAVGELGGLSRLALAQAPAVAPASEPLLLSWNENALGLAPAARQAIVEAAASAHRYPDTERERLRAELAAVNGVGTDNVMLGNGSTEILQMVVQAASAPGAALVLAAPTFEAVVRYQRPLPYELLRVPLDGAFAHDLERMREAVGAGRPAVVYLCNPNNPTGTLTASAAVDAWIEEAPERVTFLVDEAYFEYVRAPGYWSALRWIDRKPNVIVTRTFSKIYAMAGLRLGYAFAHPETVERIRAYQSSDNANVAALAAARVSLADGELVQRSRAVNDRAKAIAHRCLDQLGLSYLPSHANFLMHEIPGDLGSYIARMLEAGIRVGRPFPPLLGYNRLSLGLPEEMERWAATMRDFRRRGWV